MMLVLSTAPDRLTTSLLDLAVGDRLGKAVRDEQRGAQAPLGQLLDEAMLFRERHEPRRRDRPERLRVQRLRPGRTEHGRRRGRQPERAVLRRPDRRVGQGLAGEAGGRRAGGVGFLVQVSAQQAQADNGAAPEAKPEPEKLLPATVE